MPKTNLDVLSARLLGMQYQLLARLSEMKRPKLRFEYDGLKVDMGDDDVINTCANNLGTLRYAMDELQRMGKQIAAMRYDLKNIGCENCAHQDCGNTEEPCKSCGIRELKWEWEGAKMDAKEEPTNA